MALPFSPGTTSSLVLRIGQLLCAIAAVAVLLSSSGYAGYSAFSALRISMGFLAIWSFILAVYDVYCLITQVAHHGNSGLLLIAMLDWAIGGFALATAASAAAVTILLTHDTNMCRYKLLECPKSIVAVTLAFLAWLQIAVSALAMLKLYAKMS